jgi:hypothetical protein
MSRDDDVQRICKRLENGKWEEVSANTYFPHELAKMADSAKGSGYLKINDFDSTLSQGDHDKIGWTNHRVEIVNESPYKIKTQVDVGRKVVPSTIDPGPFAIAVYVVSIILLFFIVIPLIGYSTVRTNNGAFKFMLIFGIVLLTLVIFANITHWLKKNWDDNKCFAIGIVVAIAEILFLYMCL